MFNYRRARKAEKELREVERIVNDYLNEIGASPSRSFFWPPSHYLGRELEKLRERRVQAAREQEIRQTIDKYLADKRDGTEDIK